ncbi:MAG: NADH-quinone oxidoreductase subunit NuoE [candidate division KSB1 bacterium]|nr:NADH-quinone oxidoreductase subunit NuoE [candidate division KSB1 bacterium]
MSVPLPEPVRSRAQEIIRRYPEKRAAVIQLLHLLQDEFGAIDPRLERMVAELAGIPLTFVRQVVTFYTMFRTQPAGRYHIKVCRSISCHLMGATTVLEYLQKKLGIEEGQTTPDGRFTLSTVECLGACELAPMMQVNGDFYGPLNERKIDEILEQLK